MHRPLAAYPQKPPPPHLSGELRFHGHGCSRGVAFFQMIMVTREFGANRF